MKLKGGGADDDDDDVVAATAVDNSTLVLYRTIHIIFITIH